MKPLVSIIFPVYNVDIYLTDSLNSIINQTYKNIEVIAVNDGSTDNSKAILEKYEHKLSSLKIITQKNQGLSGARNTGIKNATGKYYYFFDSDDIIEKKLIETCVDIAETQNAEVVTFDGQNFGKIENQTNLCKSELTPGIYSNDIFFRIILESKSVWLPVWLFFYSSKFIKTHNLQFKDGLFHEDTHFTPLCLTYAKKIYYHDEKLYYYRQRGGSIIDTVKLEKSIQHRLFVCEDLYLITKKIDVEILKQLLLKYIYKRYLNVLCFIEDSYKDQSLIAEHWKIILRSIYKKKSISNLFYLNDKANFLHKYYLPRKIKAIKSFQDNFIIRNLRLFWKYKVKTRK